MWRSLNPRRFFHFSVHKHSSSSSTIPSPYHVPTSLFPAYSSATSCSGVKELPKMIPKMKGSAWWNYEDCRSLSGFAIWDVAYALEDTLRGIGIQLDTETNIFSDISQLSTYHRNDLPYLMRNFNHIPKGGNNTVGSVLIFNLSDWVSQNPPPGHIFIVSAVDRNLDKVLQHLKKKNFHVWLATVEIRDPETSEKRFPEGCDECPIEAARREMSRIMWRFRAY